jgi:hypothetical protein
MLYNCHGHSLQLMQWPCLASHARSNGVNPVDPNPKFAEQLKAALAKAGARKCITACEAGGRCLKQGKQHTPLKRAPPRPQRHTRSTHAAFSNPGLGPRNAQAVGQLSRGQAQPLAAGRLRARVAAKALQPEASLRQSALAWDSRVGSAPHAAASLLLRRRTASWLRDWRTRWRTWVGAPRSVHSTCGAMPERASCAGTTYLTVCSGGRVAGLLALRPTAQRICDGMTRTWISHRFVTRHSPCSSVALVRAGRVRLVPGGSSHVR